MKFTDVGTPLGFAVPFRFAEFAVMKVAGPEMAVVSGIPAEVERVASGP